MPPEDQAPETQADPSQNLKAEFDRKLENLRNELAQSNQQLASIIQSQLANAQQQSVASAPESQEQYDLYEPEGQNKFMEKIGQIVDNKVSGAIKTYEDRSLKQHQIYSDFPELQQANHPFTQEVSRMYGSLSPEQKKDDNYFQTIIYQVAARQGLKPQQFRESTDDFTLGSSRGEKTMAPKDAPEDNDGIAPGSMAWMKLLNEQGAPVDPNNKEHLALLKKFSQRKGWTKRNTSPEFKRGK